MSLKLAAAALLDADIIEGCWLLATELPVGILCEAVIIKIEIIFLLSYDNDSRNYNDNIYCCKY